MYNVCMMLAASFLNPNHIVQAGGILAISLIIFAETGLLVGFFLPGDTLLIAAGIFAAEHHHLIPLWGLLPAVAIAAILGYEVGYSIGLAAGPRFFKRQDGLFFRAEYVTRTNDFFTRHGGKSVVLARFIAVVRTVVPLVAGMGKMDRRFFRLYNVVGAILWTFSVTLAAYWIGQRFKHLDKYIVDLLVFAMIFTVVMVLTESLRSKRRRANLKKALREEWDYFFKHGENKA
jgi:membrane-associated protein